MFNRIALVTCIAGLGVIAQSGPSTAQHGWSDYSAAAAIAYCMAVHPNRSPAGAFTNGFEHVSPPGYTGAVRRNYIYDRLRNNPTTIPKQDDGTLHTCPDACREWGRAFSGRGVPLHTATVTSAGKVTRKIPSGVGDIAAFALRDWDFPSGPPVIAGFSGIPQNYHMNDGAQADFCCCHLAQ
jgi:hypothetical protein